MINVKRNDSGDVDVEKTMKEIRAYVEEYAKLEKTQDAQIKSGLDTVFKKYPNKNFHLPILSSYVVREITDDPEKASGLVGRVEDYIRNHQETFEIGRGRNSGVRLLKKTG